MTLWVAGDSVRGPAHAMAGTCNQDAIGTWGWQRGIVAAVCDGMGSRPLSHVGSRQACHSVRHIIRSGSSWDEPKVLIGRIYRHWMQALPVAPSQAPCTVLLAACRPDGDTLIAQLGDGLLAYRAGGQFGVLTPARAGFSNETDALGQSRAWADWRVARLRLQAPGDGVVLMTDGVSDDLVPARLEAFVEMLRRECASRSRRQSRIWLRQQLTAWQTPEHGDDKTIAMIFRRAT